MSRNKIREGKSKILYTHEDANLCIQYFKDDATAFNAQKKGTIKSKGIINNAISCGFFEYLKTQGIPSHFVEKLSDREMLVTTLEIIPVEVVVRNRAAGSICKRLGIEPGKKWTDPLVEFFYKSDELGDPLISEGHIFHFQWATPDELQQMVQYSLQANLAMTKVFAEIGLELIDYKLEFGRQHSQNNKVVLADEITPDGCRLWDMKTGEPMDKDRFRKDLGKVDEAYEEVFHRLKNFFTSNCPPAAKLMKNEVVS